MVTAVLYLNLPSCQCIPAHVLHHPSTLTACLCLSMNYLSDNILQLITNIRYSALLEAFTYLVALVAYHIGSVWYAGVDVGKAPTRAPGIEQTTNCWEHSP